LHDAEEPDVTGFLSEAIDSVLQSPGAPDWADQYSIKDDPPVNVPEKQGKGRPRVDIVFEWVRRGNRPLFRIEAKWIGARKPSLGSKKGYLGDEGIGCFLQGHYPVEIGHAGMLGYVHSDTEAVWAEKIRLLLVKKAKQLNVRKSDGHVWKRDEAQGGSYAFIAIHDCPPPVGPLQITHLLLQFR